MPSEPQNSGLQPDEPARARVGVLPQRESGHVQVGAVERCRAGQDAVIVVGEPLRLHQRVLAAGGASGKIGRVSALVIEGIGKLLAALRHEMDRPVAKILYPLRMAVKTR